jgi:hypothetical protein
VLNPVNIGFAQFVAALRSVHPGYRTQKEQEAEWQPRCSKQIPTRVPMGREETVEGETEVP